MTFIIKKHDFGLNRRRVFIKLFHREIRLQRWKASPIGFEVQYRSGFLLEDYRVYSFPKRRKINRV